MEYEYKDLSILSRPSLSPQEAWEGADPVRRAAWFPNGPPGPSTKTASPYELPPAQPAGLTPELEAAVRDHQLSHYADPICPRCRMEAKDGNARGGRCPHRPGPAALAEQRRWQRHADATRLAQDLAAGRIGNPARVVTVGQALAEDGLRAELHAMVEGLLG
jgi:hypothetical protein